MTTQGLGASMGLIVSAAAFALAKSARNFEPARGKIRFKALRRRYVGTCDLNSCNATEQPLDAPIITRSVGEKFGQR
jgi:hypothetical protein